MPRRWPIAILTTCALLALVVGTAGPAAAQFPLPGASPTPQPGQPGAPGADPRVGQIRAGLEKNGLKVRDVVFAPRKDNRPPMWVAETDAGYSRPSGDAVFRQAFIIWVVTHNVVKQDPAETLILGSQFWTKYILILFTSVDEMNKFIAAYQRAQTDAERNKAFDNLKFGFRVYDLEKDQFVDEKDFVNKNFGGG